MTGRDDAQAHFDVADRGDAVNDDLHHRRRAVAFTEGQTIIQAALAAGVYIPHLCYHPEFKPHGSASSAP